jgi:hypothetical protein
MSFTYDNAATFGFEGTTHKLVCCLDWQYMLNRTLLADKRGCLGIENTAIKSNDFTRIDASRGDGTLTASDAA